MMTLRMPDLPDPDSADKDIAAEQENADRPAVFGYPDFH